MVDNIGNPSVTIREVTLEVNSVPVKNSCRCCSAGDINPFIWRDIVPRRTLSRLDPYCHLKWQRYTAAQPKASLTLGGDTRLRYEPTRYNQNAGNMGTPVFHDW